MSNSATGASDFNVEPLRHDEHIMQHLEHHVTFNPNAPVRLDDPNIQYSPDTNPGPQLSELSEQLNAQMRREHNEHEVHQPAHESHQPTYEAYQPEHETHQPAYEPHQPEHEAHHAAYEAYESHEDGGEAAACARDAHAGQLQHHIPHLQGIGQVNFEADQHGMQIDLTTAELVPGGVRITKRLIRRRRSGPLRKIDPDAHEEELHAEHVLQAARAAEVRRKAAHVQQQRAQELQHRETLQRRLHAKIVRCKERFEEEERRLERIRQREARKAERLLRKRVAQLKAAEETNKPRKRHASHAKEAATRRLEHRKDSRLRLRAEATEEKCARKKAAAVRRAARAQEPRARVEEQKWRAGVEERAREARDARRLARQRRAEARQLHQKVTQQLRRDYDVVVVREHNVTAPGGTLGQGERPQTYSPPAPTNLPVAQDGTNFASNAEAAHAAEIQRAIDKLRQSPPSAAHDAQATYHPQFAPQAQHGQTNLTWQQPQIQHTGPATQQVSLQNIGTTQAHDMQQIYAAQNKTINAALHKLANLPSNPKGYQLPSQDTFHNPINTAPQANPQFSQQAAIDRAIQNITNLGRIN